MTMEEDYPRRSKTEALQSIKDMAVGLHTLRKQIMHPVVADTVAAIARTAASAFNRNVFAITNAVLERDGAKKSEEEELYYIQDTRVFTGNAVTWWCPDGKGYTTHINQAGKYTWKEACSWTKRETDKFWPCDFVDQFWSSHVDHQHIQQRDQKEHGILASKAAKTAEKAS
jgi:hypothetical protein